MFENHRKSRIQHCERSELRLHFEWTKGHKNAKNSQFWQVIVTRQVTINGAKIGGKCQN